MWLVHCVCYFNNRAMHFGNLINRSILTDMKKNVVSIVISNQVLIVPNSFDFEFLKKRKAVEKLLSLISWMIKRK